eukprot:SAG31_NODE_15892_length_733_cov_1.126183_1_plen_38_part_01
MKTFKNVIQGIHTSERWESYEQLCVIRYPDMHSKFSTS